VNIIPAPWFERRRGLAVSVAFNGATLGGVTLTPALYRAAADSFGSVFAGLHPDAGVRGRSEAVLA